VKREIDLTPGEVKAILGEAKKNNLRDYLLLRTLTIGDFRVGEVVGSAARKWLKEQKKWTPAEPTLPGLRIHDLRTDGVWVQGKGWKKERNAAPPKLVPLPLQLLNELKEFIGTRKDGRIFEVSESRVEQITRLYAKRAGVKDWKLVHPHRFRHFTTTQIARKFGVLAARDIARHANISTTNRYIAELPEEEKRKIIQDQTDLISV
jgi:site-specific recombinase XerC